MLAVFDRYLDQNGQIRRLVGNGEVDDRAERRVERQVADEEIRGLQGKTVDEWDEPPTVDFLIRLFMYRCVVIIKC